MVIHLAIDGDLLLKDSEEASDQADFVDSKRLESD
jgi:hypothetical protein